MENSKTFIPSLLHRFEFTMASLSVLAEETHNSKPSIRSQFDSDIQSFIQFRQYNLGVHYATRFQRIGLPVPGANTDSSKRIGDW